VAVLAVAVAILFEVAPSTTVDALVARWKPFQFPLPLHCYDVTDTDVKSLRRRVLDVA